MSLNIKAQCYYAQQATWSHYRLQICTVQSLQPSWSCGLACSIFTFFGLASCLHLKLTPPLVCRPWTSMMAWQRSAWHKRHRLPGVNSDAMLCIRGNELQVTTTSQHPISLRILAANKVLQLVDEIWQLLQSPLNVLPPHTIHSHSC